MSSNNPPADLDEIARDLFAHTAMIYRAVVESCADQTNAPPADEVACWAEAAANEYERLVDSILRQHGWVPPTPPGPTEAEQLQRELNALQDSQTARARETYRLMLLNGQPVAILNEFVRSMSLSTLDVNLIKADVEKLKTLITEGISAQPATVVQHSE